MLTKARLTTTHRTVLNVVDEYKHGQLVLYFSFVLIDVRHDFFE